MIPDHEGIFWVKVRRRYTNDEPEAGRTRGWECLQFEAPFSGSDDGTWREFGDETGVNPRHVVEIGPEILPPAEET